MKYVVTSIITIILCIACCGVENKSIFEDLSMKEYNKIYRKYKSEGLLENVENFRNVYNTLSLGQKAKLQGLTYRYLNNYYDYLEKNDSIIEAQAKSAWIEKYGPEERFFESVDSVMIPWYRYWRFWGKNCGAPDYIMKAFPFIDLYVDRRKDPMLIVSYPIGRDFEDIYMDIYSRQQTEPVTFYNDYIVEYKHDCYREKFPLVEDLFEAMDMHHLIYQVDGYYIPNSWQNCLYHCIKNDAYFEDNDTE